MSVGRRLWGIAYASERICVRGARSPSADPAFCTMLRCAADGLTAGIVAKVWLLHKMLRLSHHKGLVLGAALFVLMFIAHAALGRVWASASSHFRIR